MQEILDDGDLARVCPCFIRVNGQGKITHGGPSLIRCVEGKLLGQGFLEFFKVEHPRDIDRVEKLWGLRRNLILRTQTAPLVRLRGIVLERDDHLLFVMGHVPDQHDHLGNLNLRIADFSPTDGTLDMVMAMEMRKNMLRDTQELAEKLRKERQCAEEANQAKSAFLAFMSHEIRTPLNGVLGMADGLSRTKLDEDQEHMLDIIRTSGRALLTVLNDILDLSKIEKGFVDLSLDDFEVSALVNSAGALFKAKAQEKGLQLDVRCDRGWFRGDSARIQQVLNNLVFNAIKFTREGYVRLDVSVEPDGRDRDRACVIFRVEDSGIGIAQKSLVTLFTPFVQASKQEFAVTKEGTGLGLSIARQLCQAMGGKIEVQSIVDKGSTFIVKLPLLRATEVKLDLPDRNCLTCEEVECRTNPPLKVLVAEDNVINQTVICTLAKQLPISVDIAEHGLEAVEKWRVNDYNLILMDVQMPELNGVEAAKRIREEEKAKGLNPIPIYTLTANVMRSQLDVYEAAGINGCLAKPIDLEHLKRVIALIMRQNKQVALKCLPEEGHNAP
ncbi:ATP-binding protein [Woodsholea maritima]|uniref:ATP-binding protein n=1 Tax=Woodsholea maritima TaxID=240237 RepID=UPI000362EDBA|nr:ATP-binding protein [Woodsholea maritima]